VNYQFTWASHVWSHFYASAEEIFDYFKGVVTQYDLGKYIRLSHTVAAANWEESKGQWRVTVRKADGEQFEDWADVFINATGFLSNWEWPKIAGLQDFEGTLIHGAAWPKDFDASGKKVAVIGSGSTAVQIVSNIAPLVDHLYTWVRSPVWVMPAYASQYAGPNGTNLECRSLSPSRPCHC
jgi:cation diffusion facilitator CzcD-associated flavoprotein CzcO